jgi:hypothetical protein
VLGAIVLAIIYFISWQHFAYPYRIFPSDDKGFYGKFLETKSFSDAFSTYMPVYFAFVKTIYNLLVLHNPSHSPMSTLLGSTLLANSVILFLLCLIIYRITKSYFSSFLGAIIYGTSAYPANYFFLYSYTPVATMLILLALSIVLSINYSENSNKLLLILSGMLTGLFFWSSPSSAVMVMLFALVVCFLHLSNNKNNFPKMVLFLLALLITIAIFSYNSIPSLLIHVKENIHTEHYSQALDKFGYIPKAPFFSFFHILGVYNVPLLAFFSLCSIVMFASFVIKVKKFGITALIRKITTSDENIYLLYLLLAIIWLHLLIIDILPTTKLGRTHFVVYPLVIILISSSFSFMHRYINSSIVNRLLAGLIAVVIVIANITFSGKLIYAKTAIPNYLETTYNPAIQDIFCVREDPHCLRIMPLLEDFNMRNEIDLETFIHEKLPNKKYPIGLILGPQGKDSGLSIMNHCVLNDFNIDKRYKKKLFKSAKASVILPYYSQFPSFLMEEEICQALFFEGKINDKANITFLYYEG